MANQEWVEVELGVVASQRAWRWQGRLGSWPPSLCLAVEQPVLSGIPSIAKYVRMSSENRRPVTPLGLSKLRDSEGFQLDCSLWGWGEVEEEGGWAQAHPSEHRFRFSWAFPLQPLATFFRVLLKWPKCKQASLLLPLLRSVKSVHSAAPSTCI